MSSPDLAIQIRNQALALGFDLCGIVKVDALKEYAGRVESRIKSFPEAKDAYASLLPYAYPQDAHSWAKSVIVCVNRYGIYKIPPTLEGRIGKYYLFDYRRQKNSREYERVAAFESYLKKSGLKTFKDLRGATAARWAAAKAGLGIIRNNNFLYTKFGSWVWIETWLIDKELEYIETPDLPTCPESCSRCSEACPTGALSAPLQMNLATCVSRLTYSIAELPAERLREQMGQWIYGCDDCQDACPMNQNMWNADNEFPDLEELAPHITLEQICSMTEKSFTETFYPKFWYIPESRLWLWKSNALRAMANSNDPKYAAYIELACEDEDEFVRSIANWAYDRFMAVRA